MFDLKLDVPKTQSIVDVKTTNHRGFTPQELAEDCVKKIIYVSENVDPVLKDQAKAYSIDIEKIIAHYMKQAISSDRTTVYNAIMDAGHPDLAELIRRL
jgi:hypothetical protein